MNSLTNDLSLYNPKSQYLPPYFHESVITLEMKLLRYFEGSDLEKLMSLLKLGVEYYSDIGEYELYRGYENKLRELMIRKDVLLYLKKAKERSPDVQEHNTFKETVSRNIKQGLALLKYRQVDTHNVSLKEAQMLFDKFESGLQRACNACDQIVNSQSYFFHKKLLVKHMHEAIRTKLSVDDRPSPVKKKSAKYGTPLAPITNINTSFRHKAHFRHQSSPMIHMVPSQIIARKKKREGSMSLIFGNYMTRINYHIKARYENAMNEIMGVLGDLYNSKVTLVVKYLDETKELELLIMGEDSEQGLNFGYRNSLELMKKSSSVRTNEEMEKLNSKLKAEMKDLLSIQDIPQLLEVKEIQEINMAIMNNIVKAIVI